MDAPHRLAEFLTEHGYHPRSNAHSNALGEYILDDLVSNCPKIRKHAATGQLVYDINFEIHAGASEWNIDLVLGEPPGQPKKPPPGQAILRAEPSSIRVAVEAKAVMTEHRKASRNRQRDLDAFHTHIHNYDNDVVAAGVAILNIAGVFTSPLRNRTTQCPECGHRFTPQVRTPHKDPEVLVAFGVQLFRALPFRSTATGPGAEAMCIIVVDHDNAPGSIARLHTDAPAPQVGDPLHYDRFIQSICQRYTQRF
jgi:hypothetical protein